MTDTVAGPTIADLPRFLPYIRRLAGRFVRGLSIDADDFVQEVCLRVVQYPRTDCTDDDCYRRWLFVIARNVRLNQIDYERRSKRSALAYSIDAERRRHSDDFDESFDSSDSADLLPPSHGGQYEHTLLGELKKTGRSRLQTRNTKGKTLDEVWCLLWKVAGGYVLRRADGRERNRVHYSRRALREDFSL